jgi:hypothetical protein
MIGRPNIVQVINQTCNRGYLALRFSILEGNSYLLLFIDTSGTVVEPRSWHIGKHPLAPASA